MEIRDIPVERIVPNAGNPRREWEGIDELAASIGRFGLWTPLTVVEDGDVFRLLDGERRLRALKLRKVQTAACRVLSPMEASDESMMLMVGNSNRDELTDEEKARGVQQMMYLGVSDRDAYLASDASLEDVEAMGSLVDRLREREEKARAQNAVRNAPKWQMSFEDARMVAEFEDDDADVASMMHAAENGDHAEFVRRYNEIRSLRETQRRTEESAAAVEDSGAALVDWEEFREMRYGTDYTEWVRSQSVTKKGCGCDGFSAAIDPSDGRVRWFCAKPENHKGPAAETEEQRAARERREAWAEACDARRKWILGEVTGHIDGAGRFSVWVNRTLIDLFRGSIGDLFDDDDAPPRDFRTACLAYAWSKSETNLYTIEDQGAYADEGKRRWIEMYDTLVRLGYTPSDIEVVKSCEARKILERHEAGEKDE